jgi:hypothetical protein
MRRQGSARNGAWSTENAVTFARAKPSGASYPGLAIIAKLATVLEVEPAELLTVLPGKPERVLPLTMELAALSTRAGASGKILSAHGAWSNLSFEEPARPGSGVTGISRKSIGYARGERGAQPAIGSVNHRANLDLVTECGARSRVCYLELRIVTPIYPVPSETLRLKGGQG